PYTDCSSGPSRMPPATRHRRPQPLGLPSPAGTRPTQVASESRTALPQARAPPIAGWLASSARSSGPFAPPVLPGFLATTSPSAPVPRIGTLILVGPPLGFLPSHRGARFPRSAHEPAL